MHMIVDTSTSIEIPRSMDNLKSTYMKWQKNIGDISKKAKFQIVKLK